MIDIKTYLYFSKRNNCRLESSKTDGDYRVEKKLYNPLQQAIKNGLIVEKVTIFFKNKQITYVL